LSFSLINHEIIWQKVCKFNKLAANNLAHEFVGNGGVAGALLTSGAELEMEGKDKYHCRFCLTGNTLKKLGTEDQKLSLNKCKRWKGNKEQRCNL